MFRTLLHRDSTPIVVIALALLFCPMRTWMTTSALAQEPISIEGKKPSSERAISQLVSQPTDPSASTSVVPLPKPVSSPLSDYRIADDGFHDAADKSSQDRRNIWGYLGGRIFFLGDQLAPNGLEYKPLFSLDTELNFWFWRDQRLYGFVETRFWGQRAGPGVTNPTQGAFDFSKRELDMNVGLAWNFSGPFEFRTFAYSFNNLNRGDSSFSPAGYNDGVGLEGRWYFGGHYEDMGLARFDVTRTSYLGIGYFPTKVMTDEKGNDFKPGLFLRGRVNYDLMDDKWYLYLDSQFICRREGPAKYFFFDSGTAVRPFARNERIEYRFGFDNKYDFELKRFDTEVYLSLRLTF